MKYTRRVPVVLVMSCLCLVFITMPAYGYVDPNATGLISQILTPLLIAAAASATFLRNAWDRCSPQCPGGSAEKPMISKSNFQTKIVSTWFRLIVPDLPRRST